MAEGCLRLGNALWLRYVSCNMSTVEEIKKAVAKLSLEERAEFAKWFNSWEDDEWDRQMQQDARSGKLDQLLSEVDADIDAGRVTDFPRRGKKP